MQAFSLDSETYLIRPAVGAPPMVCLQFMLDDQRPEIIHARDPALPKLLAWALANCFLIGHVIAYDLAVICATFPELIPAVFQALAEDRVTCTQLRQKLADIALGCFEGDGRRTWGYHLDECVFRCTEDWPVPVVLDKEDPWRLKYGTLWNTPVAQWPREAVTYGLNDPWAARTCFNVQGAAINPAFLLDQFAQTRAAFWIRLMECRGFRTDPVQTTKYHQEVMVEMAKDRALAQATGMVRADGTRYMKAAMARMVAVMNALGEPVGLTEAGEKAQKEMAKANGGMVPPPELVWQVHQDYIKLDEDACLASGDDLLQAFQRYGSEKTTIGRVERLYYGWYLPLQASFQSIVETGRTSCRMGEVKAGVSPPSWGFQLQNLPRKEGMRECFIPRAGPAALKPQATVAEMLRRFPSIPRFQGAA